MDELSRLRVLARALVAKQIELQDRIVLLERRQIERETTVRLTRHAALTPLRTHALDQTDVWHDAP